MGLFEGSADGKVVPLQMEVLLECCNAEQIPPLTSKSRCCRASPSITPQNCHENKFFIGSQRPMDLKEYNPSLKQMPLLESLVGIVKHEAGSDCPNGLWRNYKHKSIHQVIQQTKSNQNTQKIKHTGAKQIVAAKQDKNNTLHPACFPKHNPSLTVLSVTTHTLSW